MSPSLSNLQSTLRQTLTDLEIQQAVQESVRELTTDIEVSEFWNHRIHDAVQYSELNDCLTERSFAVDDIRAIEIKRSEERMELADKLVEDLWNVSRLLGDLQSIRQQNDQLLLKNDELFTNLRQTEEQIQIAKRHVYKPENNLIDGSILTGNTKNSTDVYELSNTSTLVNEINHSIDNNKAEAIVALDNTDEDVLVSTHFEDFENKVMMNIFSFLDAIDILNAAQINRGMYSKVDSMFGLTGHGLASDENENFDVDDSSTIATNLSQSQTKVEQHATIKTSVPSRPAPQSVETKPAYTVDTVNTSKPTADPFMSTHTLNSSKPERATTVSTKDGSQSRNLFKNILPSRKFPTPPRFRKAARNTTSFPVPAPPMTPDITKSVAGKLSAPEMSAILLITDRLKQKDHVVTSLWEENQTLTARLDGTESVKQFLFARIREMEQTLTALKDNDAKVAQQISVDQEVIAFLDGRVQELKLDSQLVVQDKQELEQELERVKKQTEQKAIVMGDMLQYERERLNESDRDWKAAKKLLIKEVKNCRAQIMALQAERDGFRQQNEQLRRAALSASNTGLNNSARGNWN